MKKCSHPAHPHCTLWVVAGEAACANGHRQPATPASSFELISALRGAQAAPGLASAPRAPSSPAPPSGRPQLHISGFDPRAAGGRQAIKLELRGMPPDCAPEAAMRLRSALMAQGGAGQMFTRTPRGDWRPVVVEFSSRNKEHGQYQIDVELRGEAGGAQRRWACTMLILVPRADATLSEIHQIFLSTHKNVRVVADDASIARLDAHTGGGRVDLDVTARNASIAHLKLDAQPGKVDMGFATIAWDEDLIEIDAPPARAAHPHPSRAACLVNAAPEAGLARQTRLFALGECVLGRFERRAPEADVLLAHYCEDGQDGDGLTRRISGRHALIRRGAGGYEVEDVSRYGLLVDGVWPGRGQPVRLRLGMRLELTASIKGVVVLSVSALLPNGVILHRIDQGARAECFYLLDPERHPGAGAAAMAATPRAAALPLLFHQHGGFWHLDQATGVETALHPGAPLEQLRQVARHNRFSADPYPDALVEREDGIARYQASLLGRAAPQAKATA
ncbi:FHA domain-containing protein [Massilia glaciei]|uniref:FHA domain-containing protein n=1 Tax=Massilia glaciei TaxID=1524097 RepID=A0A2U2I5F5_9BURK|nr:FHA domain-containing protein [Massilia glaciei]PWF54990.1 FHA domain-containing protein [Massilia glaciei]